MKAKELQEHMQKIGTWVNWEDTEDRFLAGDPESEVKGIAVSWMATFPNLKRALEAECNLFVTHEHLFTAVIDQEGKVVGGSMSPKIPFHIDPVTKASIYLDNNDAWVKKKKWVDETKIVVYRCHDFWDDFPEIGVLGAWADWLGFNDEPVAEKRMYEVHETGNVTLGELAQKILQRVKPLGQDVVHVVGDLNKKVSRIAIGTGVATHYRHMFDMGADVLLLTDDGTHIALSGQWSIDSGIPLIIVNHATSEEPGMRTLAKYIQEKFPKIPVTQIPVGCIYKSIK
jgi:putative NIF3 family GTP cyclohydrolase 1 type 2